MKRQEEIASLIQDELSWDTLLNILKKNFPQWLKMRLRNTRQVTHRTRIGDEIRYHSPIHKGFR